MPYLKQKDLDYLISQIDDYTPEFKLCLGCNQYDGDFGFISPLCDEIECPKIAAGMQWLFEEAKE